ncbi:hypothetical protein DICPUDRAFT_73927 [Dictyostelium purpureum]|uniref:FNIP repeat-containing protein n=1 Tax=Dictyostelium purpureum TaxID=5786 RepID=F0Z697_DICPU|nr:uncharacterized protein DICPUDRAFT_73927 [Dictyostelium purpureum]EGC40562.1 hypothetical protein DICPUDRAFT_73927 [Dictyostelium purpureum]|eukprot:XP_003282898.1 hypothetical protein DICPUDRAFT_73927 [Dictyostelium purpureum]
MNNNNNNVYNHTHNLESITISDIDNNNKNEKLFFSVWRNKYLLNEIQRHHRLYNENKIININKSMDQLRYHPHRRYATEIIINVGEPLEPHGQLIPYGTTKLNFFDRFNKPIQAGDIPTTVTSLELDQDIPIGTFPLSLTTLKQNKFNRTITPGSFGSIVNLSLESFNQPLKDGDLPITCKYLYLGSYNQPLQPNILPPELKELKLLHFNHPLSYGVLPESITDLNMNYFNHPLLYGVLPESITNLNMNYFDHPLSNSLSALHSLKTLFLGSFNQEISIQTFPHSIEKLWFFSFNRVIKPNVLPPSITDLLLYAFNQPLSEGVPPESITDLHMNHLNCPLSNSLSTLHSLKKLNLQKFNQIIKPNELPSITQLNLDAYNHPLSNGVLPESITFLSMGKYNHPLSNSLSTLHSLKTLFLQSFNQVVKPNELPESITSISKNLDHSLSNSKH